MWLSALVVDAHGNNLIQCDSRLVGQWFDDREEFSGQFQFPAPWLKPGYYRVDLFVCAGGIVEDQCEGACRISVSQVLPYHHSSTEDSIYSGLVFSDFRWRGSED